MIEFVTVCLLARVPRATNPSESILSFSARTAYLPQSMVSSPRLVMDRDNFC
jgi:hypothetical protein